MEKDCGCYTKYLYDERGEGCGVEQNWCAKHQNGLSYSREVTPSAAKTAKRNKKSNN